MLWLSTSIVHHANRVRPNPRWHEGRRTPSVVCVDGRHHDRAVVRAAAVRSDRVSVKPHASPVLHAINYLLGELDAKYLTTLREFGGLQSYPSRAKDPDPVDYSTGSVGIGATAPIWGAFARRYVDATFASAGTGRQYSLVGDAELDEGAVWEAILDPSVRHLGEIVWIVDMNRQIPGPRRAQHRGRTAGGDVLRRRLAGHHRQVRAGCCEELFARPGGAALRARILTTCPTPSTSACCAAPPPSCASGCPGTGPDAGGSRAGRRPGRRHGDAPAIRNLGGHDLDALREAFTADRRHPPDGDLRLHHQGPRPAHRGTPAEPLLAADVGAVRGARRQLGHRHRTTRGRRSPTATPAAALCAATAARLRRAPAAEPPATRGARRPGPHPVRYRHHPGRPRPRAARPRPGQRPRPRPASSPSAPTSAPRPTSAAGSTRSGCGRPRAARLVRRRPRDDPALARAPHRPAPGARHRRDQPRRAAR